MTKKLDLSIIIVNYNTRELLKQCLKSLPAGAEIIVVDNHSFDGSVKLVNSLINNSLINNKEIIKLILNKENFGFAKANNQALRQAQSEYLLFLNPDTVVPQKTIPELISYLEKHQQVGAITPLLQLRNGRLDPACHRGFPTPWAAFCYFAGLEKLFPKSKIFAQYHQTWQDLKTTHEIDACSGAFLLTRRRVLDQIGLFDEQYFFYGEDLDLCYRIKQVGYQIIFYPQVKAIHYKGVSSGIRSESQDITQVDKATSQRARTAASAAMAIFYDKFYQQRYPALVTFLVKLAIRLKSLFD